MVLQVLGNMTLLPQSGKNGYMIWDAIEIPIYSWNYSELNERTWLKLSHTENIPYRNFGPTKEEFLLVGVDYIPAFLADPAINDTIEFELGWIDFFLLVRNKVEVRAMLVEYTIQLLYHKTNQPSYMWMARFIGCTTDKEFDAEPIHAINDHVRCQASQCGNLIITTDTTLNGGSVEHVRNARLTTIYDRPLLVLSDSNNHLTETIGGFDYIIDMTLEGDFDYWNEQVNSNARFDYAFFYDGIAASFQYANMKAISLSNVNVDLRTAEVISASLRLGASNE